LQWPIDKAVEGAWRVSVSDTLQLVGLATFFGFIVYYVLFRAPASDKVYSSLTEADVNNVQAYLEQNGITTYVKSRTQYQNESYGEFSDPSLHVIDAKERARALQLINGYFQTSPGRSDRIDIREKNQNL
jgi:type III secretory pathway lipoprotein EscJ